MSALEIYAFISIALIEMFAESCFVETTSQKTRRPESCQKGTFFVKTYHEVLFGLIAFERRPLQARTAKFDMTFDDYKIEFSMTKTRDDAYITIGQEILYFPVDIQITPYVVTFEDRVRKNIKIKCSTDFTPREHYEAYIMKIGYSSEVPIPGLEIEFYAPSD
ncbi:hypothetical protein M3Y96_00559500 [Aphelenchoides besseyi]|nr:hypothetical protein M3Y96_00559500 [Aphelenchoides besseyi]